MMLFTIAPCIPVLHGGFVWDDASLITDNRLIKASDGLYRFWFTAEATDYYPVTSSLWWCQWRLWGANPVGYHVVNVLLHAVNAVLIWLILQRLKIPGAWLAALVFAVHPVNVATVAWISEQKNTLSMSFSAMAVLFYLQFDERPQWRRYVLSLTTFLLALLSKSAVVMLPVVLLGCAWWRRGKLERLDVLRTAPFFALSLILGLVTVWFQTHRALEGVPVRADSFAARLAAAGWIPWFYLYKALVPVNLTVIYPNWHFDPARWSAYLPGIMILGSGLLLWWKRRTWGRPWLFGLGYFVMMLFPVLGFFDQGFYQYSQVADHWQYYSIVGVTSLAVAGGTSIYRSTGEHGRRVVMMVTALVLVMMAIATWQRSSLYANEETLWRDNTAKSPTNWGPYYNLGVAFWRMGDVKQAIVFYEQALQLNPDSPRAHYNMGIALLEFGKLDDALKHWQHAARVRPAFAPAQYNLGVALLGLGRADEAVQHLEQALHTDPSHFETHNALGAALLQLGRTEGAVTHWEQALRIQPNSAELHANLGVALLRLNRAQDAVAQFEQALRIRPDYAEAHRHLSIALAQLGRHEEAVTHYRQAFRIEPGDAEAHAALANALMRADQVEAAIQHYELALRFNPEFAEVHNNLGAALVKRGRLEGAIRHLEKAIMLRPEYAKAHYNLATALEQMDELKGAIKHYEEALRIQPDLVEAEQDLARLRAEPRKP